MSVRLRSKLKSEKIPSLTARDVDAAVAAVGFYPGGYSGRGITVCAGGFTYFANAWVLVRMLRKLGCELPVQFWHYGEKELDAKMRRLVEPHGVECVDAKVVAKRVGTRIGAGWPLKPFSILHSPFEEVLALDADNVPIRDPEYLFQSPEYQETGAIFWPDVGRMGPGGAIWELMGVPYRNEMEFESAQIVTNKALCWEPLNLAMWMNEEGKADFIYKLIWGDKDTFRFAWHKFGFPFAMPKTPLQMLTVVGGPCCTGVMCQHDLEGERIFQHRTRLKWQLFGENPWVPGFLFDAECREFLAELRTLWNGRIGAQSTKPARRLGGSAKELAGKVWLLETVGSARRNSAEVADGARDSPRANGGAPDGEAPPAADPWPMARQRAFREIRFMAEGNLGRWSGAGMTFWDVREDDGEVVLNFAGDEGIDSPTARLRLQPDGSWLGRTLGTAARQTLRLRTVDSVYPSSERNDGKTAKSRAGKSIFARHAGSQASRVLHVFNSAGGIGDHVTALYACVGAVNAGREIVFHTRFPQWLSRVQHPGLSISGDLPPGIEAAAKGGLTASPRQNGAVDLNRDPVLQLRHAGDKARWYADVMGADLKPARPESIDRTVHIPRFDFDRYVVLAPFSAWARRDWPGTHWTRLTHLLREAGYEVVAIGMGRDNQRFEEVFGQTTALWAIDHPPEWVMDAMLGAACVIGNDSGMIHVAGMLGATTLAIHAHLPADFLFSHARVRSISPKTNCTFCRWQPDRDYNSACDAACSALATVGPEEVLDRVRDLAPAGERAAHRRVAAAHRRMARMGAAPEVVQPPPLPSPAPHSSERPRSGGSGRNSSLRGMIAVTIGVGTTWEAIARIAARRCRKMTGLRTVILDEETMGHYAVRKPHHLKFHLFDEFPNADTILYFDADTVFLRPWNVREHRRTNEFVCVRDLAADGSVISEANRIGIAPEDYFNSGLFIASAESHAPMFHAAGRWKDQFVSWFHDQTYLNGARAQLNLPVRYLDRGFNRLRLERAPDVADVVVGHFRWIDSKPKEMIADYFHHWCEKGERTPPAATAAVKSLLSRDFVFRQGTRDPQSIAFHADQSVEGAGSRRFWEISMAGGKPVLWLSDDNLTLGWLRVAKDRGWRGESMHGEPWELCSSATQSNARSARSQKRNRAPVAK